MANVVSARNEKIIPNVFYYIVRQGSTRPIANKYGRDLIKLYRVKTWPDFLNCGALDPGYVYQIQFNKRIDDQDQYFTAFEGTAGTVESGKEVQLLTTTNAPQQWGTGNPDLMNSGAGKGIAGLFGMFQSQNSVQLGMISEDIMSKNDQINRLTEELSRLYSARDNSYSDARAEFQDDIQGYKTELATLRDQLIQAQTTIREKDFKIELLTHQKETEIKFKELEHKAEIASMEDSSGLGGFGDILKTFGPAIANYMAGSAGAPVPAPQMYGMPQGQPSDPEAERIAAMRERDNSQFATYSTGQ